jgi:hypothetical protein
MVRESPRNHRCPGDMGLDTKMVDAGGHFSEATSSIALASAMAGRRMLGIAASTSAGWRAHRKFGGDEQRLHRALATTVGPGAECTRARSSWLLSRVSHAFGCSTSGRSGSLQPITAPVRRISEVASVVPFSELLITTMPCPALPACREGEHVTLISRVLPPFHQRRVARRADDCGAESV